MPQDKCPHPETLSEYHEGELTSEVGGRIQKHLENCTNCREILNRMTCAVSELKNAPKLLLSEDFTQKVLTRTKKEKLGKSPLSWSSVIISVILASIFLTLAGSLSTGTTPGDTLFAPFYRGLFYFLQNPEGIEAADITLRGTSTLMGKTTAAAFAYLAIISAISGLYWNKRLTIKVMSTSVN